MKDSRTSKPFYQTQLNCQKQQKLRKVHLQLKRPFRKRLNPKSLKQRRQAPPRKLLPWFLGGGAAVIVIIILAVSFAGGSDTPAEPAAPTPSVSFTSTNAPAEEPADAPEEPTEAPTEPTVVPEEPASDPQPFFTGKFDGDLSHWSSFVTSGDENRMDVFTEDGKMIFELGDPNSDLYAYYVLDDFTYENVQLEAVATNRGVNENNVSLICRYTGSGWYEFNIGNDGLYTIFAYDSIIGYDPLFSGGSTAIKSGQSTNKYTALCEDNKLTLWINDVKVRTVTVNRYNYPRGKVGLSVSSFQVLPVKIEFKSLTISEP